MLAIERKLNTLKTKLEKVNDFTSRALDNIILTDEAEVLSDFIRKQLSEGLKPNGEEISLFGYSKMWASERANAGLQTDFVDLKFSGRMYEGIEPVSVTNDVYFFDSDVPYTTDLIARYGEFLGLSEEDKDKLKELVREKIKPMFKNYLQNE
jgi:hypothetical protein